MDSKLIIHVGLHKTGTTFLQKFVFPYLSGVLYLGRPFPKPYHTIERFCWSGAPTSIVSSETFIGRLLDSYRVQSNYLKLQLSGIDRLASLFPTASIIVGVRMHAPWVLSCYKHYLKYGGKNKLKSFFSLDGNSLMHPDEFLIYPRLHRLTEKFENRILVFQVPKEYSEWQLLIRQIEGFTSSTFTGDLGAEKINVGVCSRQGGIMRQLNQMRIFDGRNLSGKRLRRFDLVTRFVPKSGKPIAFPKEVSQAINEHYALDWQRASTYFTAARERVTNMDAAR